MWSARDKKEGKSDHAPSHTHKPRPQHLLYIFQHIKRHILYCNNTYYGPVKNKNKKQHLIIIKYNIL